MLGDDLAAVLPELREHAESLMVDAGTAMRPTGGMVYDPGSQSEVEATAHLFTSRCKIQARDLQARDEQVGGRTATTVRLELHLPADTAPLEVGDLFEVTAVHPLSTARLTRYRVLAPVGKTWATANRYEIEEVVS